MQVRIVETLSDAPRSGRPAEFEPEEILGIIAIACEDPKDSDLPLSHWTAKEVRREAIARGVVKEISQRSVARFLEECDLKPHRMRYWFRPRPENQEEFEAATRVWFSILSRRLLRRANFVSVEHLRDRILAFIEYFNATMAKPFKWTYRGRPLAA